MRTPDPLLRQRFLALVRSGPSTTAELAERLRVSLQTVRRLAGELPPHEIVTAGPRGRIRHALARPVHGTYPDLPLFAIDAAGRAASVGALVPVHPHGTLLPLSGTGWPVPAQARDGWWEGLPYPVYAMRPAGYLGRRLARAEHANLGVADDPDQWTDDDILWVLSRRGTDVPGNLILGAAAYDLWARQALADPQPLAARDLGEAYARLADEAVATNGGGSSAAGEFPKFAALRDLAGAATPHVLVKFSGRGGGPAERRRGDLLICEHLALEHARLLPTVEAARSRVIEHAGRVFLETERFDRVGMQGRLAMCGLDAIDPAFFGARDTSWPALAARLARHGLVAPATSEAIERLWWFGRLIANTDMHTGNVSFLLDGALRLAPAYDMLPMAYAPLAGGEVPPRTFEPPLPQPQQRATWQVACAAAVGFWSTAASDRRISEGFRRECAVNAQRLQEIVGRV